MDIGIENSQDDPANTRQVFRLLILYRWISLIPVALVLGSLENLSHALQILSIACLVNLIITLSTSWLNLQLRKTPWFLLVDMLFLAGLFALSGGWASPYYLYAFSPLLVAAFFFGLRGALVAAGAMAALFGAVGFLNTGPEMNLSQVVIRIAGFFLTTGIFGYATHLLDQLKASHADLRRAHRDLEVIHSLTLSLQRSVDVNEVQERVLTAVVDELGFSHAAIALVDQDDQMLADWLGKSGNGQSLFVEKMPYPGRIPLTPEAGILSTILIEGQPRLSVHDIKLPNLQTNGDLSDLDFHVFPMLLREHAVGVLLVASSTAQDAIHLSSLRSIASQAAVAVGTTMLCIDRARKLAVQDERIRIAREIHDTVSQSLFGMSYALDACTKLLPGHPQQVKSELHNLTSLAEIARSQLRQSIMDIWPSQMTAQSFATDLRKYVDEHCHKSNLELAITVRGEFDALPSRTRRDLYRIAQEAVTNVSRHAAAHNASICMAVDDEIVSFVVADDGRGFAVEKALAREQNREHFGLRGIQERVEAWGGQVEFLSQPGTGTMVLVSLPVSEALTHG